MTIDVTKLAGDRLCLKWNAKNLKVLDLQVNLHCHKRGTVVQAGGNLGVFPKWLAARFKRVVTFEADHDNFLVMCRNAPEPNIIRLQAALGFERKSVGMAKVNNWGRTHAGVTHVSGPGLIPTIRLDDLGLDDVDFLQLDVEGHELEALQGGINTIRHCLPVIMVEINKNATLRGWSTRDAEALLGDDYVLASQLGADKVFLPREQLSE